MSSSPGSRFSGYTRTDHQAPLWIATSITLAYAGLFLIVRVAVKYKVLGLDDLSLGIAHVLGVAQWGTMYAALDNGIGKRAEGVERRDGSPQMAAAKLVFVSRILTLVTVGFTKASVLLFLRQLFTGTANKGWNICNVLLIGTGVWTLVSTVAVSINCSPTGALLQESGAHCTGDLTRWRAVTGIDFCGEIILVIIPAYLFYSVNISRTRKLTIIGAFLPRIVAPRRTFSAADYDNVPAVFIAYLEAYISFRKHGGTSIDAVNSLIWQQVLCGYSLISATTLCLRGFLGLFRTDHIAKIAENSSGTRTYGHNSRSGTNQESYVLESLDRNTSRRRPTKNDTSQFAYQPADVIHSATAYAEGLADNGKRSLKSFGSQRMMIHRKIEDGVTSA